MPGCRAATEITECETNSRSQNETGLGFLPETPREGIVRKLALLVAVGCVLGAAEARAEWTVKINEPDVFGNKVVTAISASLQDGLVARHPSVSLTRC